ncbi:MAG TPA: nucleotidyltransferase family protein [bacterium]|jgi:predicted nucleotidyltransferase|nr:nucleotidyltransferase family protein [bacterium]
MISVDPKVLAAFCKSRHIRKLSLFGSAIRPDFKPRSDIDLLAEFESGQTPGLSFFSLGEELASFFGRKVDLNTVGSLNPYFREQVLSESETLYDASRP